MNDTLAMLVNCGQLQDELFRLASREELAILGSSVNITGTRTKVPVEDIEILSLTSKSFGYHYQLWETEIKLPAILLNHDRFQKS